MSYFSSYWEPVNQYCSSPGALSGIVDRNGMGDLGKLPVELVISIFKHIPFRERLRASIFVSKSFQGLLLEKTLWKDIELSKCLVAPTLGTMIRPTNGSEPLLPQGSITSLTIDTKYCTTGSVIGLIKRLHAQLNTPTTLTFTGPWHPLVSILFHLPKAAHESRLNLSRITTLSLSGDGKALDGPIASELSQLLAAMPMLEYLSITESGTHARTPDPHSSSIMPLAHRRVRTLIVPFLCVWLEELRGFAESFPELEELRVGVVGAGGEYLPMPRFLKMREMVVVYFGEGTGAPGGEVLAEYVLGLVGCTPGLRRLSWVDERAGSMCVEVRKRWGRVRRGVEVRLVERRGTVVGVFGGA